MWYSWHSKKKKKTWIFQIVSTSVSSSFRHNCMWYCWSSCFIISSQLKIWQVLITLTADLKWLTLFRWEKCHEYAWRYFKPSCLICVLRKKLRLDAFWTYLIHRILFVFLIVRSLYVSLNERVSSYSVIIFVIYMSSISVYLPN